MERKNSIVSSTIFGPARRFTVHRNALDAALVTLANERLGMVSARYTGFDRKRTNRSGASSTSIACRDGGVSITTRS